MKQSVLQGYDMKNNFKLDVNKLHINIDILQE